MILSTTARCYMSMTQFCPPFFRPSFLFLGGLGSGYTRGEYTYSQARGEGGGRVNKTIWLLSRNKGRRNERASKKEKIIGWEKIDFLGRWVGAREGHSCPHNVLLEIEDSRLSKEVHA